ncbi:MAG: hypothetical protein AB8G11_18215 [Saprospiraceae bacterium]
MAIKQKQLIEILKILGNSALISELSEQLSLDNDSNYLAINQGSQDAKKIKIPLIRGFKGGYNADTQTPNLSNGVGLAGDFYRVSVAGSVDFGNGFVNLSIDDILFYNGSKYINLSSGGGLSGNTIDSNLDESLAMQSAIGGIPAGTTIGDLNGLTLTQYIEMKDFPTILASVHDLPNFTSSGFSTSSVEVGTTYSPTLSIGFDLGKIKNGNGSIAGDLVGDLQTVKVSSPSNSDAYLDNIVSNNSSSGTLVGHKMSLGINTWVISGTNLAGTTTYEDNKGGSGLVSSIESQKNDTIPTPISLNKSALYYRFNYLGGRGTSPTNPVDIRAINSKAFLSTSNTASFSISIPANTSEYTLYIPNGKSVSIVDASTFSDLSPTGISVNMVDAAGDSISYKYYTVDMGLTGFPQSTTFNIIIS